MAALLLSACAGARDKEDPAHAALVARKTRVQQVACLRPAERRDCEEGARIDFAGRSHPARLVGELQATEMKVVDPSGAVWCKDGVTHGSFRGFHDDSNGARVEGVIGQAVWEALWRVVDATGGCVSAYDEPITVTRGDKQSRCEKSELDMWALVERAYQWAHRKVPRITRRCHATPDDICEISPCACQFKMPGPPGYQPICPVYDGDE